jgi:hypothetical protein
MTFDVTLEEQDTNFDVDFGETTVVGGSNGIVKKYYSLDMDDLKNNNVMFISSAIETSSNMYNLTVAIGFIASLKVNDEKVKIIDIPVEWTVVNGAIWLNKHNYKSIGLISSAMTQFGINGNVNFDAFADLLKNSGFRDVSVDFGCMGNYKDMAQLKLTVSGMHSSQNTADYFKDLFEQVFSTPGNKLILEYQEQKNVETVEAEILNSVAPITELLEGGESNG